MGQGMAAAMNRNHAFYPFVATLLAIAILSLMDGFMKSAAIAAGAYSALLARSVIGFALIAPVWWRRSDQGNGKWPSRQVMRIHVTRSVVVTFMALTFFSALVYLPLAEAIALSFISPLIALVLAVRILKEKVGRQSVYAAMLGLAGVLVIVGGRMGRERLTDDALLGTALVLVSAFLYAWNLILQRQQALKASPLEISTFGTGIVTIVLALGAPFFFSMPEGRAWLDICAAAVLSLSGALLLSWAYSRAEAQVLVPVEYTGFAWAALVGWLFFAEEVQPATVAGAALIILGSWIAAPRGHSEQAASGAPL